MKQLKFIQSQKSKEPIYAMRNVHPPRLTHPVATGSSLGQVKSSPSNNNIGKTSSTNSRKKNIEIKIKNGDMAEFLKRKELRVLKAVDDCVDEEVKSTESTGRLRDVGCQTMESNLSQKLTDNTKLTMLYPKKENDDSEANLKASGDTGLHRCPPPSQAPRRAGDELIDIDRNRSRLNSILERKDTKDPYLPSGYQKGVVPKYIRERKEQGPKEAEGLRADDDQSMCPSGHVTLPDTERKETLRMLRNSFAELVSELNKLPVKTDTLKMRNRKMELEKQLAKLEEGIKVFSRPKVFVKIGE